jgi:hypothetical protein
MSIITESQLKNLARSRKSYITLNDSLKNFRNESSYLKTKIFLSHKHDEKEYLEGAISLLKNFGVEVYIDWQDESMPNTTSSQTAVRIKQKIRENHKFVLLATEGAINSKWCNWELGLGDAAKYIEHIALLPVRRDSYDFTGSEYLEVYPYIFINDTYQFFKGSYRSQGTYVVYPSLNDSNKVITIAEWLRNR